MRIFNRQAASQQKRSYTPSQNFVAPVGGLNTRDNYGEMPIQDAIELTNWMLSL